MSVIKILSIYFPYFFFNDQMVQFLKFLISPTISFDYSNQNVILYLLNLIINTGFIFCRFLVFF